MSRYVLAGLVALLASSASIAHAQGEGSSADMAAALGQEGVKLADAGSCAEAVDRFQRAEKLVHVPMTLERLGECQVHLGKIVLGSENLDKVARETTAPAEARERAKQALAEATPKIAKLKIAIAAPRETQPTLKIDGDVVALGASNTPRPMDPGVHLVEVSAPGYKTADAKVTLAEGGTDAVALTLERDANAAKPVPPSAEQKAQPPAEAPPQPPSKLSAYISLGIGAAGVGLGTVFGLAAVSKKNDLEAECPVKTQCPASAQDTIDSAESNANIATVGFILGAVGLFAGAYLYIMSNKKPAHAAVITPVIGPSRAGFRF